VSIKIAYNNKVRCVATLRSVKTIDLYFNGLPFSAEGESGNKHYPASKGQQSEYVEEL